MSIKAEEKGRNKKQFVNRAFRFGREERKPRKFSGFSDNFILYNKYSNGIYFLLLQLIFMNIKKKTLSFVLLTLGRLR